MEIALLNVKTTIQKNTLTVDEIGNHLNGWTDYYTCHATVSGEGGKETVTVGMTAEDTDISFTVRYCKAAKAITSTGYRVIFQNEIYNIISIDHMNFKRKAIKLRCQKVSR